MHNIYVSMSVFTGTNMQMPAIHMRTPAQFIAILANTTHTHIHHTQVSKYSKQSLSDLLLAVTFETVCKYV